MLRYFYTMTFLLYLVSINKISKTRMKRYAEIGLPWQVNKIICKSVFFLKQLLISYNWQNQMLFQNQLLISHPLCSKFFVSIMSAMSLPLSIINLLSTNAVSQGLIKNGNTFFSLTARAFDLIFRSTFKREIGLQFWINLLPLLGFSINSIVALWNT